jgi:hypothetical protein
MGLDSCIAVAIAITQPRCGTCRCCPTAMMTPALPACSGVNPAGAGSALSLLTMPRHSGPTFRNFAGALELNGRPLD